MKSWLPLLMQLAMQFIAFWIKDKSKKEAYEREIKKRAEEYQKETGTSADIRAREKETKDRLLEKLRQRTHGVSSNQEKES